jgi:hypothetical protein
MLAPLRAITLRIRVATQLAHGFLVMNRFLKYWRITGRGEFFRAQIVNTRALNFGLYCFFVVVIDLSFVNDSAEILAYCLV